MQNYTKPARVHLYTKQIFHLEKYCSTMRQYGGGEYGRLKNRQVLCNKILSKNIFYLYSHLFSRRQNQGIKSVRNMILKVSKMVSLGEIILEI